jgi:hypothetical protein
MPNLVRMLTALPKARRWVNRTIAEHREMSRPVLDFGFQRLADYFPQPLLESTRVVVVQQTPQPPLHEWGIHAVDEIGVPGPRAAGITLRNCFFVVHERRNSETLFFHELIHVIQWQRLGVNLFLALYGLSLLRDGYADSPLEIMAYELQDRFDQSTRAFDVVPIVERRTDEIVANFRRSSWMNRIIIAALA